MTLKDADLQTLLQTETKVCRILFDNHKKTFYSWRVTQSLVCHQLCATKVCHWTVSNENLRRIFLATMNVIGRRCGVS